MLRKKRVLIVEDEESLLKLETILLTVKGFEVIGAVTGKMAIDMIGVEHFDLVLLDIMLPDIDGFEVCRQIRKDSRTTAIPIIMLTGKKSQNDHDKGVLCGANAYLVKPFKSAMIIAEINKQLALSETGE
jgi:twitching motility two-component system response regulator PilG